MKKYLIPIIFASLIILYTHTLIGLWGQVGTTDYPDDYEKLNDYLSTQNITGHIIYLPWESYLTYNWTLNISRDGRIAVPINKLIKPIVITGPDRYGGTDELQNDILTCLNQNSMFCLEDHGVQFIIEDRCTFYPDYEFLKDPIFENSCIRLYELYPDPIQKPKIPLRFFTGIAISLLALISILLYTIKSRKT